MPMICAVSGCANRSDRETNRSFFRLPKVVVHKGEKCRQLTEKRRETWLSKLYLRSGGAESLNARVCSDHFVHGCPSALKDVQSVDYGLETRVITASGGEDEDQGRRAQRL